MDVVTERFERFMHTNKLPVLTDKNARVARTSFEAFRRTIHPEMLWNPFVLRITRELQEFAIAYEGGKRPKLAFSTPPQVGKECADSTPICTTRGWITHGDLRVNDHVFHPSSRPVRVLWISEKTPSRMLVELSNGDIIRCHERHEWSVIACRRKGKPILTMETQELMRSVLSDGEIGKRGHHYQFYLPRVQPLQGVWQALPLSPYALGAWLGNGTRGAPVITQQAGDEAVIEGIQAGGYVVSARTEWTQATGTKAAHFAFGEYAQTVCSFVDGLRPFGFMEKGCVKYIPDQYLLAPLADRLELLAGLIDTDGSVYHPNGRVTFCTADESLMLTFKRLIATFGWHCAVSKIPPRGFSGGEIGPSGGQDCYNIGFSPTLKIPCKLPRKQLKRVFDKAVIMPVAIKSVTFDDRGEVGHCITVDSPDGLYLVGETMQPTHNSLAVEDFALWMAGRRPDWRTIYASYSEELGKRISLSMQRTMVSRRYREVFPHMMVGVPGWIANNAMTEFARYQGSFRSTTINGPITGLGLNLGLLDDYVKGRAEANSKLLRDKTWEWFADDFLTRFSKDGAFLGIATRWHIDDLFGRLKKKWPEMRVLNFPAFAEKEEGWRHKGDPLFPEHRPLEMWLDQKRIMSEASWAAEYQGHPFLSGSGAIPVEKLRVVPFFDRSNVAETVMSVDKAGTEGGSGAFTAIVIMSKMRDGTFVIEDVIRGHWGALERERIIKQWADSTRDALMRTSVSFTVVVEVEPGSGGKESAESTARNLAGHIVVLDKPGAGRSKEVRAEPFCAMVQAGQVYLHAGPWIDDYVEECGNFPMAPIKDMVDASAMGFHHLTGGSRGYSMEIYDAVLA